MVGISALDRDTPMADKAGLVTGSLAMDDLIAGAGVPFRALCMPSFMDNLLRQPAVPFGRPRGPPAAQRTKARRRGASGVPAGSSRWHGNRYLGLAAAGAVTIVLVIAITLLAIHRSPVTGGSRGAGASAVIARVYSGASYGFNTPNRVAADGIRVWVANAGGNGFLCPWGWPSKAPASGSPTVAATR